MIPIRDHYESIEEWARALSQSLLSDELASKDLDQQNILGLIDALAGKVEVAGDTMTGALTLPGAPTVPLHASTKQYVDDVVAGGGFLPLTGGVMTGKITLDGNPTVDLHAVPRQYVDAGDAFDDSKHGVRGGGNLHADVIAGGADGFMKGVDKTKLDGIATGATVDQSDSEIKTAYENNANTNEFSDDEQTKLAGIETGAKDDLTASEILTLIKTVDGGGSGLDADLLDNVNLNAGAVANTVGKRDGSADFVTRLLRQTYGSANGNGSYFLTQNQIGASDNYARPMTLANVRAVLGGSGNGLDADKLDSLHAVDFVKKDGSVAMTGLLTLSAAPSLDLQAATKKYADDVAAGVAHYPEGLIYGYQLIWNSINGVTFVGGNARDFTDVDNIVTGTPMTKLINVSWVSGGGGGMEPTQLVQPNRWYGCFVIKNRTSGAVDYMYAGNTGEPNNYPTGYTISRRVGHVLTDASENIIEFDADYAPGGGLNFRWTTQRQDFVGAVASSATTIQLSAPPNIKPLVRFSTRLWGSTTRYAIVTEMEATDSAPSSALYNLIISAGATTDNVEMQRSVNGSSQIRARSNGSGSSMQFSTIGWLDQRWN